MDIFTKFNRKSIQDRQIDTLIGLSKGIAANGAVDQAEAQFLLNWLIQSRQATENPVILNLLAKIDDMLEDGVLGQDESKELLSTLQRISGPPSVIAELAKTTTLPLDNPPPPIEFESRVFLFTGTCAFGTRKQCRDAVKRLGGTIAGGVTKKLDYLVIGTYVTDSWAHENYGRKIEKAMAYRDQGVGLAIVSESDWAQAGRF